MTLYETTAHFNCSFIASKIKWLSYQQRENQHRPSVIFNTPYQGDSVGLGEKRLDKYFLNYLRQGMQHAEKHQFHLKFCLCHFTVYKEIIGGER